MLDIHQNTILVGWCECTFYDFRKKPPERWVPGGIIILTRETKIAEMNFSEPFKNNFQSSEKSVEEKIKNIAWKIAIFHDFHVFWKPKSHHL